MLAMYKADIGFQKRLTKFVLRVSWVYLDPEKPTCLGLLIMVRLYESLKGRFFRVQVRLI